MARVAVNVLKTEPELDASRDPVFDRAHLERVTFGNRGLEREILQLFDRQAVILLERMRDGSAAATGALAHTLKGSASAIGACGVARAAAAVELATISERETTIDMLARAVEAARAAIARMLAG